MVSDKEFPPSSPARPLLQQTFIQPYAFQVDTLMQNLARICVLKYLRFTDKIYEKLKISFT